MLMEGYIDDDDDDLGLGFESGLEKSTSGYNEGRGRGSSWDAIVAVTKNYRVLKWSDDNDVVYDDQIWII